MDFRLQQSHHQDLAAEQLTLTAAAALQVAEVLRVALADLEPATVEIMERMEPRQQLTEAAAEADLAEEISLEGADLEEL